MKPITLNLASRPFRNNTLMGSLLGVVGVTLVCATAFNLYFFLNYGSSYARLQEEQAADRQKITGFQVEERRLVDEVRKRNFRQAFERGKVASDLIVKSAFSWTQLFNTLENVVPPDVVTTAIRPTVTVEGIMIRVEGVAKNHGALLSFEERLQRSPSFTKVFPASERRLNPNLPDITFLLTCGYLPQGHLEKPRIAEGESGTGETAPASGPIDPASESTEPGAKSAKSQPVAPPVTASTYGRGGRSRDAGASATSIIAPGAVYLSETKPAAGAVAAVRVKKPPAEVPKTAGPSPSTVKSEKPPPPPPRVHADANPAAPPAQTPTKVVAGPRNYDPNDPRTMTPEQRAARMAVARTEKAPVAATRLDLPLSFVGRPVEEIFRRLAEAHAVRFELDDSVDRQALVTVNLQGRKLEDAILLVSGVAQTRVRKLAAGVYKVSSSERGKVMSDAPVVEEALAPEGNR